MKHLKPKIKKVNSLVEYNYLTIKITQSRINKGLIAIPVSLIDKFPDKKQRIKIYFDDKNNFSELNFTPYSSSSRECRIGGLKDWFLLNQIQNNDEIVIQLIDEEEHIYRIISEKQFLYSIRHLQKQFDTSQNDSSFNDKINKLANTSNISLKNVYENEFIRLSNLDESKRNLVEVLKRNQKESVPYSIKKVLGEIYKGKCQLTNFTFIQKNGRPYFEIHHINENKGNFLKNLLVVSPNIHAQFTYSKKFEYFDENGWLRKVKFNRDEYKVFQYIDFLNNKRFFKEIHQ